MALKIQVDEALCTGTGQCVTLAPDLLQLDDEGYCAQAGAGFLDVPADLEQDARAAEGSCPEAAILIVEENA